MALPLMHTLERNASRDAALGGAYGNLRIHGLASNMNPALPWSTLAAALATDDDSDKSQFGSFSSTCFYFGQGLSDRLAAASGDGAAPPIGLVHTAYGGSTIEQWLSNATTATCDRAAASASNQQWHDQRVLPYADMTLKGWVWYQVRTAGDGWCAAKPAAPSLYLLQRCAAAHSSRPPARPPTAHRPCPHRRQGENDMHNFFGNSQLGTGYSCLMQKLVAEWRRLWSAEAGTTHPLAPFGLVTLAPSGGEGGKSIGTMRWAQTAGYGATPNAALPNVFSAQAYDLNDPNANITCYGKTKCHDNSVVPPGGWPVAGCDEYCASVRTTNFYMGPIHPRDKKPVGERLAQAAGAMVYSLGGSYASGPTLSGCRADDAAGGGGSKLTLTFNRTLLGADAIAVQPYYDGTAVVDGRAYTALGSKMEVLLNASLFCMQLGGGGCLDDGTGRAFNGSIDESKLWVTVDIAPGSAPNEVVVDLSRTNGTAFAIRYADNGDCCSNNPPSAKPCPPASCPIMGSASGLPANPFVAHIVGGKCKCVAPQTCDE